MKKKLLAMCMVTALAATAIIGGTLAYFTDNDVAENTFTVGNVEIDLTEPEWDDHGETEAVTVYPGESLDKDPTVENIGNNPCFVRVSVSNLDQFGDKGAIVYLTNWVEGALGEGWVDGNDGYFYWSEPLVVKGTENDEWNQGLTSKTTALFDQIKMPTGLTGDEETKDIVVTAQAVQAQGAKAPNWAAVKGMTVAEIQAWFSTVMAAETPNP
ncbi:MAG: SipW-dependent-type signal peptide-containing protein [Clostridiales bacterium]|nr:SipW-dependent-type signal peptide-containing protein [Clostridiales bacterium]